MTRLRILSLLALALLAACDPAVVTSSPEMTGEWLAVFPSENGARTEQRMTYGEDGSYTFEIIWYGFYNLPSSEVTGRSRATGQYRLSGGRLELRIRQEEWQRYAAGPNPSVTVHDDAEWSGHGTVRIEGDRLLHTFVSAPADAPIESTLAYLRAK
ncbi:MAG TPA: hypothetical protein VF613_21570 [Longimicrobium sp.]|jgi:hypothetical protein